MLHAILTAGNRLECFRWDWIDRENKVPGIWTEVGASFTVFHEETETFSTHWLSYEKDRAAFLAHYGETVCGGGNLDEPIAPNAVPVSMIPWVTYTGFHVNLPDSLYLRPVVTMGRYVPKIRTGLSCRSRSRCITPWATAGTSRRRFRPSNR